MAQAGQESFSFEMDADNLYHEESYTDLKVGTIKQMIPVKKDGTVDPDRAPKFVGQTQLMSPHGPLPIHCVIEADNLMDAVAEFPRAARGELDRIAREIQRQQQQQNQQQEGGRIIVPGR